MGSGNGQGRDDTFYAAILQGIGAPVNAINLAVIRAWARAEGGTSSWNPLNATQSSPGATNYNYNNGTPVKNYVSRAAGIDATIRNLNAPNNTRGYYGGIIKALKKSDPVAAITAIMRSPWDGGYHGGGNYKKTSVWSAFMDITGGKTPTITGVTGKPPAGKPKPVKPTPAAIANAPKTPPIGLVNGDGAFGTAFYDPLMAAIVVGTKVYQPFTLWIQAVPAAERKKWRIIVDPGAVWKLGDKAQYVVAAGSVAVDPGGGILDSVWPDNLTGQGSIGDNITPDNLPSIPNPLEAVGGFFSWITDNMSRIGLALAAVLIVVLAVVWQNRGAIAQTASSGAKVAALV